MTIQPIRSNTKTLHPRTDQAPEALPSVQQSAGQPPTDRPIALALGGGGARGVAHIGVIQAFEAAGYRVAEIAGTSAGALYAAGYAFGLSTSEILDLARRAPRVQIFRPWPGRGAIVGHAGLEGWLTGIFGDARIEDCRVPLTIVATRARDGATTYLRTGPIVPAIVASATIPLVFPPVQIDGELLVDGGVSLPVPETAVTGPWPVIAVDLGPGPLQGQQGWPPDLWRRIERWAGRVPGPRLRAGVLACLRQNAHGYRAATGRFIIRPAVNRWEDLAYLKTEAIVRRGHLAAEAFLTDLGHLLHADPLARTAV